MFLSWAYNLTYFSKFLMYLSLNSNKIPIAADERLLSFGK